jgi:pyruvate/2-oxoglutarate dehydrogenase complex dihydrolipoamide dehydrogenase (E3) component
MQRAEDGSRGAPESKGGASESNPVVNEKERVVEQAEFDVVVIGAGPAGEVCAGRLGEAGLEVVIVEGHLIGGECSYYGCMPSKALLRPAEALAEVRRIPGAREAASGELDVEAVLRRRDEVIHDLDDTVQVPWLETRNVTVIRGRARLIGERIVDVDGRQLTARRAVVVATGSEAVVPPVPGLAEAQAWTNREATTADAVPERLIVLGGGAVGVELGQAWASLGSQVAIVEALPRLLSREEPFAAEQVREALVARGVDVRTGVRAVAVSRDAAEVIVQLEDGATLIGDRLLVAVGRRPSTRELGVESVGLESGAPLLVDDELRVLGFGWLYAIGDVNGRSLLTHMGKYQARIAADVILGRPARVEQRAQGALSPRVVFTDPQVAAVGHTLESARAAGIDARAVDQPTSGNAGGSFYGRNAPGTSRIVVDEGRRVLVGATFTGAEVAEFVHAATIAIVAAVPLERLWHAVPSFPTRSEVWLRLLETYGL